MKFSLDNAVVYDIESFKNAFTLNAVSLWTDSEITFEISDYRDDRQQLMQWFNYLHQHQVPMIGFNTIHYDYPMIHNIFKNPNLTAQQINQKNDEIINGTNRFANVIWERDRFAPQIDLFKIHHFDNRAKSTSLKALQFVMRSGNVMESAIPFGINLTREQLDQDVIPYNRHDTEETKRFAHHSMDAIRFRMTMIDQFGLDVLNWNDTKIGEEMLIARIGEDVCYERVEIKDQYGNPVLDWSGNVKTKRQKRQTVRSRIALNEIIFPYIRFSHPEFQRILDYMRSQTLLPDEFREDTKKVQTKGVFTGLKATINDFEFHYGLGGIHGSVPPQKIVATDEWVIRDIDVASLYPSIAIVNNLAPEHLGQAFTKAYATLPAERKEWQKKKGKKCAEANSMKLAGNGAYGKSNDEYSVLFDPKYTMTVTINGQLMLSMLAEWLLTVPTLSLVQINTDGITYYIHRDYLDAAKQIEKQWEQYTCLTLEDVHYSRMWIRDVNNYISEALDGSLKQKGAYWFPDPLRYVQSIAESQPPAWHKDHSAPIVQRAAVVAMVHGIDPATFIRAHTNPFDFMLRAKVGRVDKLMLGNDEQQRIMRYYISTDGKPLVKVSPPAKGAVVGEYKRANGVDEATFRSISASLAPGQWDERIHTKNKSKYEMRQTALQAGFLVTECNVADRFSFTNLNYEWYINEAKKLIIG